MPNNVTNIATKNQQQKKGRPGRGKGGNSRYRKAAGTGHGVNSGIQKTLPNGRGQGARGGNRRGKSKKANKNKEEIPQLAPAPSSFPEAEISDPLGTPNATTTEHAVAPDKLEAEGLPPDLDYYGTNDGLILYQNAGATSEKQIVDDKKLEYRNSDSDSEEMDAKLCSIARLRKLTHEQETYIKKLEEMNFKLTNKLQKLKGRQQQ